MPSYKLAGVHQSIRWHLKPRGCRAGRGVAPLNASGKALGAEATWPECRQPGHQSFIATQQQSGYDQSGTVRQAALQDVNSLES
jgi:hypothetical protein